MRRNVLFLICFLVVAWGCGQGPEHSDIMSGGLGAARLIVHHSGSADSSKSYGLIESYRVLVTGPGIDAPIEAEFDGDAESGFVEGIPSGSDREVVVTASNKSEKIIRQGEVQGVEISPGKVSDVEVEMEAVPIFTNLSDGNVIPNTRLRFELFADPEDPLQVEEMIGETENVLLDLVTNTDEFYPHVDTGLVVAVPPKISAGQHTFRVISRRTERWSAVTVKIVEGADAGPAPLYSGGWVGVSGDYLDVGRVGSALHIPAKSGAVWPNLLSELLAEF